MASLDAAAADRGSTIARLARWWLAELAGMVPVGLRRAVGAEVDPLVVSFGADEAVFAIERRGRAREIGRLALDAPPDEVVRLLGTARVTFSKVIGRLPAERALQRNLDLPAAAAREIGRVLTYEIERQTPFRDDQVYFTYRVVGRDSAARTVSVAMSVVPREAVTEIHERLAAWDLVPDAVDVAEEPAEGAGLLPAELRRRADRLARTIAGALGALALALAIVAVAAPLARDARTARDLEREIAALRPAVERALELENAVEALRGSAASVVRAKTDASSVVATLEALSRALPDDTWLAQFNMRGGEVEIQGASASASALVGAIERAPEFAAVRFRTPITREPITGIERFQFTIELSGAGGAGNP